MMPFSLFSYLGAAVIYALIGTAAGLLLLRRLPRESWVMTMFLILFFLTLTQYPLPDRATLDCSTGGVQPVLKPFATVDHVFRLWHWFHNDPNVGISLWFRSKILQAAAMNFLLCAAIGASLAQHVTGRHRWLKALGLAVLLSGGAEITQLTATFGLYPCPYRHFEIDDLILNISGLLAGFGWGIRWREDRLISRPSENDSTLDD